MRNKCIFALNLWVGVTLLMACQHRNVKATKSSNSLKSPCNHDKETFRCVSIVDNYDGDTIRVNIPDVHPLFGEKIGVRLTRINAPEVKTKNECEKRLAAKARDYVTKRLESAKQIDLTILSRDLYFRIGADVLLDGKSISDDLLREKLVVPYGKPINWCEFEKL